VLGYWRTGCELGRLLFVLVRVLADGLSVQFFVVIVDEGGHEFTIEVHHGGFLVGHGSLKTYLDEGRLV
jgi:hypothetical protein